MKKNHKIILAGAGALSLAGVAGVVYAGEQAPAARISMDEARATALAAAPGEIDEAEYEDEGGAWRYSFDIRENGRIHEIGVDANSGEIVEDSWENADDEANEAAEEAEENENEADERD